MRGKRPTTSANLIKTWPFAIVELDHAQSHIQALLLGVFIVDPIGGGRRLDVLDVVNREVDPRCFLPFAPTINSSLSPALCP